MQNAQAADERRACLLRRQVKVWRGGRSKPLGMVSAVGSVGETAAISSALKAGVGWKAEGGPAAPMQEAVQLLQVEC